jgi:hypothetical protein
MTLSARKKRLRRGELYRSDKPRGIIYSPNNVRVTFESQKRGARYVTIPPPV